MANARARVKAACDAVNIAFLNRMAPDDITEMIDEGVMIGAGGEESAKLAGNTPSAHAVVGFSGGR